EQRSYDGVRIASTDVRGSTRALTDTSGRVLLQWEYDAWGNRHDNDGQAADVPGFTGEPQDPATGLVYLRARWYD
ncbi:hypothetical protein ACQ7B2_15975, partial [Escherichia coli]